MCKRLLFLAVASFSLSAYAQAEEVGSADLNGGRRC